MLARLADGVPIETAAAEVDAILRPVEAADGSTAWFARRTRWWSR